MEKKWMVRDKRDVMGAAPYNPRKGEPLTGIAKLRFAGLYFF